MRKSFLILFITASPLFPMEIIDGHVITPKEKLELSKIVVSFYFSRMSPTIKNKIYPRIQESVDLLSRVDTEDSRKVKKELCSLRDSIKSKDPSAAHMIDPSEIHGQYKHLHDYISSIVGLAIEDSFADIEEQVSILKEENKRKERQKRLAMIIGVVSTGLTAVTTLIVHFVDK